MKKNLRPLELVKLMRPKHYIKNFLILVSITFDRNLFNPAVLGQVMLGFAAFCLLTSAVYVVNDIRDVESASTRSSGTGLSPPGRCLSRRPGSWRWDCWPPPWLSSWPLSATGGGAFC